jgi:hypothetical protein
VLPDDQAAARATAATPQPQYSAEDYIAAANAFYASTGAVLPTKPTFCPECGEDRPAESDFNADHEYADNGVLLIGCKGYQVQDPNIFGIVAPDWRNMPSIPDEVRDVLRAAASFEDTVQRVGTEELAEAASRLGRVRLAYLFDRLDDTCASVAEIVSTMRDWGIFELNDSLSALDDVCADLESAGQNLSGVVRELAPELARHEITIP